MTDVRTDHPDNLPYIELSEEGRRISFRKECLGDVKIYRQLNDGEAELLIQDTRTPYVDTDEFPQGSRLSYTIELDQNGRKHEYQLEARL